MVKFQKGLIGKNLETIKKKKWYRQRFDGCPAFLYQISEAEIRPEARKGKHGNFTSHVVLYFENKGDWYIDEEDMKNVYEEILEKAKREPLFSKKIMKKWDADEKKFYDFCRKIGQMNLRKLSDAELKKVYQTLVENDLNLVTSSSVIDGFALGTDEIIQGEIKKVLDRRGVESGRGQIFAVLTAPATQSFINEAEISLLRLALQISKMPMLKKYFLKNKVSAIKKELEKKYPKIYKQLLRHQENYFWSKNNYVDNKILSINYFIKEIKTMLAGRADLAANIKKVSETPKVNKIEKKKLIKKLGLPQYLKTLLVISEDFTYWQDERKKSTYWMTHYASLLMKEIGRRFGGYKLEHLRYMIYPEILSLFTRNPVVSKKEAKERYLGCAYYQKGNFYEIISGKEYKNFYESVFGKERKLEVNDFRGLTASSGKATGRVKVVKSVQEVGKVQKGDILVAVMTRPDYIVAIKKAAAIVTDEGGITCHAAIVAREIGIPCIIGTKIATKVLSDGDLVEVNANHAAVKILK
jgi:phosphoenolpyruvate synthase/pyruvate phosphate dikinase